MSDNTGIGTIKQVLDLSNPRSYAILRKVWSLNEIEMDTLDHSFLRLAKLETLIDLIEEGDAFTYDRVNYYMEYFDCGPAELLENFYSQGDKVDTTYVLKFRYIGAKNFAIVLIRELNKETPGILTWGKWLEASKLEKGK